MRTCPLALLALTTLGLAAGCSRSGSSSQPVLAQATIDQGGGTVAVANGPQAGLQLTVPAGAVDRATVFRIRDDSGSLPPGFNATSYAPLAGIPFVIEPRELVLETDATLRLPYRLDGLINTSPGNVRVAQVSPFATREYEPATIDVVAARFEIRIRSFGRFQAVPGPRVSGLRDYLPPNGSVANFEDGFRFALDAVSPASPFAGAGGEQWRITSPIFDDELVFVGEEIVARESLVGNWREQWATPYSPWRSSTEVAGGGVTTTTQVERLVGAPSPFGGQMLAFGYWQHTIPVNYDGRMVLDVLRLTIELAWTRQDIGIGQRQYVFWFAPEIGLLQFSIDGLLRQRIPD